MSDAPAPDAPDLDARREELFQQIAALGDLRPGSLVQNYRRCGRPACFCADKQQRGHGPYWLLTSSVAGKTRSRSIPADQVEATQAQIAECQRLRRLVAELITVSDDLCQARLQHGSSALKKSLRTGVPSRHRSRNRPLRSSRCGRLHRLRGAGDPPAPTSPRARRVERRFNDDLGDHSGSTRTCSCGQTARYAGRRAKTFQTVLGPLILQRAYYHCSACGHGCFPRDQAPCMAHTNLSPGVTRMTGAAAARVSFAQAKELLQDLAGVAVDTKHVERMAEALGRDIAALEERGAEAPAQPPAATVYLGVDGTGVPVRASETVGRAGKQPDGSARTREAKLVVVWTAETRDKEGRPARDPGSVSYTAAIESAASRDTDPDPSAFAQRMRREAERRGFTLAQRRVILGDGATWIWRVASEDYPGAIQIVDLWHAKEKLWEVAKALFGRDKGLVETWAEARCDDLEQGRLDGLLATLRAHASSCEEAGKCADYIDKNRSRMRYPEFRAQGLCVGSGVVEAGCRTMVAGRVKRSGMYWTVNGANAILALRCCVLSGNYEDYWAERVENSSTPAEIQK